MFFVCSFNCEFCRKDISKFGFVFIMIISSFFFRVIVIIVGQKMFKNYFGNVYVFFFVNFNRYIIIIVEYVDEIIFYVDFNLKQK